MGQEDSDGRLLERIATQISMHLENDTKVQNEINHDIKNVLQELRGIGERMERAHVRIHELREEGEKELRKQIDTKFSEAHGHAQAAHDRINGEKIKLLTWAVTQLLALLGVAYYAKH